MKTQKVSHPNPNLSEAEALKQLYEHPQFPKGAKVKKVEKVGNKWQATLQVPGNAKQAAPPPFPPDGPPSKDGPLGDDGPPSDDDSPFPEDEEKDDSSEDEGEDKVDLDKLFDLVKQIADTVGVKSEGDDKSPLEDALEDGPPPPPHGPPVGGTPPPKAPPKGPMRPGMAPPGTTPVGAPSFASTNGNGVPPVVGANIPVFNVSEFTDAPLKECSAQVEALYAPHGYRVAKAKEETVDGKRRVRIQVSKR